MAKEDNVKQALLDSLTKEPTMILSTAYVYAKNYVEYGEDITKAWTTAVQQASVIQKVRQKAWVEAYDSFKKEYEARLKSDMLAMLTDIQQEIDCEACTKECLDGSDERIVKMGSVSKIIQQKINLLRG